VAEWKVSVERILVFPHFKADRLDIARVGMHQLVVGKDNGYRDGDLVVFAPKRSVLPEAIRGEYLNTETGKSYLNEGRVDSKRMRGELSEGVVLPPEWVARTLGVSGIEELPLGEDLSEHLGITLFEYPIPAELEGRVERMRTTVYSQHDVEGFAIFSDSFVDGEAVVATEKVHGSQTAVVFPQEGGIHVSSKSLIQRGIVYLEDSGVIYWRAVRRAGLEIQVRAAFPGSAVQVFGEVVPVPGGFSYGFTADAPALLLYRSRLTAADWDVPRPWRRFRARRGYPCSTRAHSTRRHCASWPRAGRHSAARDCTCERASWSSRWSRVPAARAFPCCSRSSTPSSGTTTPRLPKTALRPVHQEAPGGGLLEPPFEFTHVAVACTLVHCQECVLQLPHVVHKGLGEISIPPPAPCVQ
jgi:RNA ligase (TIGR02306 family)